MSPLREGDRINNYLLESPIGAGSFGQVWRARHHVFGERVAIKIPTDTQYVRNLQREGVAIHGLRHANIVRAIDLDPYGDPPYLIMELVDGPSLQAVIERYKGQLHVPAAVAILRGVLNALSVAHSQGVVHRDIKPANILLNHPLEEVGSVAEAAVKVTDFGLGQVGGITAQSMLQSGSLQTDEGKSISGTLAYMSPEQKEGKAVDARSDLYSCGIVLFEMLTGERPQGNDMPSTLRPGVPAFLDQVFTRAYARYERRFASADEMRAVLPSGPPPLPPPRLAGRRVPAPHGGRKCDGCSGPIGSDDQFCIHCGQQLVAAVPRCPSCQGYVQMSDRFCIYCGKDLRVLVR